jgi:hypothetical protein
VACTGPVIQFWLNAERAFLRSTKVAFVKVVTFSRAASRKQGLRRLVVVALGIRPFSERTARSLTTRTF